MCLGTFPTRLGNVPHISTDDPDLKFLYEPSPAGGLAVHADGTIELDFVDEASAEAVLKVGVVPSTPAPRGDGQLEEWTCPAPRAGTPG